MQDFQTEVDVFADIPCHWLWERNGDAASRAEKAISDFASLSGFVSLKFFDDNCYPIQINILEKASRYKHFAKILKKKTSLKALPRKFIRLSAKISYTKADLEKLFQPPNAAGTDREYSFEEKASFFSDMACRELHTSFIDLYLALSIAHPGSIYFWESWQFADKFFLRGEHGAMTSFEFARERAEELKWPEIRTLKIGMCMRVANKSSRLL